MRGEMRKEWPIVERRDDTMKRTSHPVRIPKVARRQKEPTVET